MSFSSATSDTRKLSCSPKMERLPHFQTQATLFGPCGFIAIHIDKENAKSEPVSHAEDLVRILRIWYARRDSNPQPSEPESDALSIEPLAHIA